MNFTTNKPFYEDVNILYFILLYYCVIIYVYLGAYHYLILKYIKKYQKISTIYIIFNIYWKIPP